MRQILSGPAFGLALLVLPAAASAAPPAEAPAGGEGELVLEDAMDAEPSPADNKPTGDNSFLDDSETQANAEVGTGAKPTGEKANAPLITEDQQRKLDEKEITVVQQQAFLNVYTKDDGKKVHRFELQPTVGLSINDAFVRHYAVGADINMWLTNRMAIGITGNAFIGAKTPNYDRIRFQEGLLLTANEYLWQAGAQLTYEPFYGKVALFNRALMHWEGYLAAGGGVIHTRVLPRYESIHEPFDNITFQGNFTLGTRFFVTGIDWFSFNLGVRTWLFPDKYEPQARGPNTDPDADGNIIDNPAYDSPSEAKANADTALAWNVVFFLGASFYLPPTFQYSTRR